MKERACKNCHLITKNETLCPKCKTHTLSEDFTGEVVIINPKESKFAEYLKIHLPGKIWNFKVQFTGKYALRVR